MDKYYYLVSELPYLQFGQEQPVTRRYFMEEAQKWLSPDDYESVIKASIYDYAPEEHAQSHLLNQYHAFEYRLRSDLALWRKARKQGHEYKEFSFPLALLKDETPLKVEINMLQYRWEYIDNLEVGHHFDIEAVIAYFLKLQLLERLISFEKEIGREKFQELTVIRIEDNIEE